MTRKQCKCQYVQEQGVIFSRWISTTHTLPQTGKTQQWMENKTFCGVFFSFYQSAVEAERLSECGLIEREKNPMCPLFLCPGMAVEQVCGGMVSELLVPGPIWYSALLLFPPCPPVFGCMISVWYLVLGGLSWLSFLHHSRMKNDNNLNSWPCCDCSCMFRFPPRQSWTDDSVYFRMSDWHGGINVI